MTVNELLTGCSRRLGDSQNLIWTSAELLVYANAAQRQLCRETMCYWRQAYLNDQSGQGEAELPSDCLLPDRATWGGRSLDLQSIDSIRDADHLYQTNEGRVFALGVGPLGRVQKWNIPTDDASNANPDAHAPTTATVNNTRLEYFAIAPVLVSGGAIDLPQSYHKCLRWYTLHRAYERNGPGQSAKLAKHYETRWLVGLERVKMIRSELLSSMTRTLHPAGRGRGVARPVLPPEYGRMSRR